MVMFEQMLNKYWIALLVVLLWGTGCIDASAGDADPRYRYFFLFSPVALIECA